MAILEKRRSTIQRPRFERYQDTRGGDRAAALRGETPVTSAIRQLAGTSGYGPMADQGFNPMGDYADTYGSQGRATGLGNSGQSAGKPAGNSGQTAGNSGQTLTSALKNTPISAKATSALPKSLTSATAGKVAGTLQAPLQVKRQALRQARSPEPRQELPPGKRLRQTPCQRFLP